MRIVINSDDLGISPVVNDAIFDHIARGFVSSATLLANGPAVADAAEQIARFPQASFGVHLNATEFAPITQESGMAPILDPDGCFAGNIRQARVNSCLKRALTAEWIAQVERIRSLGVRVSHIDSHQHVHTTPRLFSVLKAVQRRCQIRKVRIAKNIYSPSQPPKTRILPALKAGWNCALRRLFYATTTTEGMTDFRTFLEVQPRSFATIELMAHPGNPGFDEETRLLSSDWKSRLPFPSLIINYEQL